MSTNHTPAGYREIEHTADWELQVWAPDLSTLLEQAARGMYSLAGARLKNGDPQVIRLELSAPDKEILLVNFLGELLFLGEQKGLGFNQFDLRVDGERLHAQIEGLPLEGLDKEIKAVTFHNLVVAETDQGLEARIVFDV